MKIKIDDAISLCKVYGSNTTLGDLVRKIQGNKIYKCPKCKGLGYVVEEYNAYPRGMPDSGSVYEAGYRNIKCDLCDGDGYTEHEYKPKIIQNGWE